MKSPCEKLLEEINKEIEATKKTSGELPKRPTVIYLQKATWLDGYRVACQRIRRMIK